MNKVSRQLNKVYIKPKWHAYQAFLAMLAVLFIVSIPFYFADSVKNEMTFFLLTYIVQAGSFILLPLFFAAKIYNQEPQALGFQGNSLLNLLPLALSFGLLIYLLNVIVSFISLLVFPNQPQELQSVMTMIIENDQIWYKAFLVFCVVILGPAAEELFFRGFLFAALEKKMGKMIAIILSSLIFALAHETVWVAIPIFFGGMAFALLYSYFRDIILNMMVHAVWNGISVSLMFALL